MFVQSFLLAAGIAMFVSVNASLCGCQDPGVGQCALIFESDIVVEGLEDDQISQICLTNGNCDDNMSGADASDCTYGEGICEGSQSGDNGLLTNVYGDDVFFGVSFLTPSSISGISYQVYNPSGSAIASGGDGNCFCFDNTHGLNAGLTCQCNFSC